MGRNNQQMSAPSQAETWADWMSQAQAGDQNIYKKLLTEVAKVLRPYFVKRIKDVNEVEDLIQEVLLGLHTARHTYDPQRSFTSWLYSIAKYKTIDYYRKSKRRADWVQLESFGEDYFSEELFNGEKAQSLIEEAISQLPKTQRDVFIYLKIEGLSIKETAKKMNSSESAIKVNAHRSYKTVEDWILKNVRDG